jgi:hypothetical protein
MQKQFAGHLQTRESVSGPDQGPAVLVHVSRAADDVRTIWYHHRRHSHGRESMNRRDFVVRAAQFSLAVPVALRLAGCGGGDDDQGTIDAPPGNPDAGGTPSCLDNGADGAIAGNHGHVLMVAAADVAAGLDKTYDIAGSAGHTHDVTVTAAQFQMLAAGTAVTITTSVTAAHMHDVTITCN